MKKTSKSVLCLLLSLLLTVSCFSFAGAVDSWDSYWQENEIEIQRGIYIAPGQTETQRTIRWYADTPYGNELRIGTKEDFSDAKIVEAKLEKNRQGDYSATATVSDLQAGQTYYYRCYSGNYVSRVYSFSTVAGNDFTALYVTDVHISYEEEDKDQIKNQAGVFADILQQAKEKEDFDVVLSTGDQATLGRRDEYCGYTASEIAKSTTLALLQGNHDRKNIDYRYFTANPESKVYGVKSYIGGDYWFVKGNALFMVMDGNNADAVYHRNFMKNAVRQNKEVKWRVAMLHQDLLGGRIPHREDENNLLRLIWLPLMDEFSVDLTLMGHSHYYTISNVVYARKSVLSIKDQKEVNDARGTVYMVSGSINHPRGIDPDDVPPVGEHIGQYVDTDALIYNLLDFSDDSIAIRSYYEGQQQPFNTFTLRKTDNKGGHPKTLANPIDFVLRFIGEIYAIFNNIGVITNVKKYDVKIPVFAGIFGL